MVEVSPIRDIVMVQAYEWPEKSAGGIYFPGSMRYSPTSGGKDPWRGKVLKVGPEVTQLKEGDIIRYQPSNYSRQTMTEDGVRYLFLEEVLIYAVEDERENPIRALKNRVVFLADESTERKYGLIYLPMKREEPVLYGTVVVVDPHTGVSPGDRVCLENKSTWQYFDSNGKRYILTDISNLLGKVEDEISV